MLQKHFPRRVNQFFSYIMCTSLCLSGWMTQLPAKRIGKYRHLVNWNYITLEERALLSCRCLQIRQQAESLQTGNESIYEELRFRRGSPLACGVMGSAKLLQTANEFEYEELHFRRGSPLVCGLMGIACSS